MLSIIIIEIRIPKSCIRWIFMLEIITSKKTSKHILPNKTCAPINYRKIFNQKQLPIYTENECNFINVWFGKTLIGKKNELSFL